MPRLSFRTVTGPTSMGLWLELDGYSRAAFIVGQRNTYGPVWLRAPKHRLMGIGPFMLLLMAR